MQFFITLLSTFLLIIFSFAGGSAEAPCVSCHKFNQKNAGKIVRKIIIDIQDVFPEKSTGSFYQMVNNLKISSKTNIVRRELVIKEGSPISALLVQESERNLRTLRYLRNELIKVKPVGKDLVDVIVSVQDTWTIMPQLSMSSGDGQDKLSLGLEESNFLGLGQRFEGLYKDESNRSSVEFVYDDRRIFNSEYQTVVGLYDRSDGQSAKFSIGDPFRTFLDKTSWKFDVDYSDSLGRLWERNEERYVFRQDLLDTSFLYSIATGNPENHLNRFSFGYSFQKAEFQQATAQDLEDLDLDPNKVDTSLENLANDRKFSGPMLSYEYVERDFVSINYIDRFDRLQDLNLGKRVYVSTQYASEVFGSDGNTLISSGNISEGIRFSEDSLLRGEFGIGSAYSADGLENNLVRTEFSYYNVLGIVEAFGQYVGRHTFASKLFLDYGSDLYKDREFLIGGDNAIRGYEARTFTGDKRFAMNIEDRVHFYDDILKLISLGGAVFFDVGGATHDGFSELIQDNLYTDVGFGLRLGFPRSSGARVLRMDISFPLRDGPDGSNQYEPRLIFSAGQIFDAYLRSEQLGNARASTSLGFNR